MSLASIAETVGGVVSAGDQALEVTGDAFVDSRDVVRGGLFVAVTGERVDGHDYAVDAVGAGAVAVLAAHAVGVPCIVVPDPVQALGTLAHEVVTRLPGLTVIGVTGSQGKTSTKDIAAQLLERHGSTVAPVGSYNNEIGVPLTALRATGETRYLVSEMGARGHGHIAHLAAMVRPAIGAVLNVGVAHLGEFGTREDIAAAKGELLEALPADGLAVLNNDDELVRAMRGRTSARAVTFGRSGDADVRLTNVRLDTNGHACFTLSTADDSADLLMPLVGEHQAVNAGAAATIALGCGMGFDDIAAGLSAVSPRSRWRMEVSTASDGVTVVNDAYNANPDSMKAALETLAAMGGRRDGGRTFAVLGVMLELGRSSRDEHDALGRLAARLDISHLVVVGDEARPIHLAASHEGAWKGESVCVPDVDAAIRHLSSVVSGGDLVLVKASRAAGLEQIAAALLGELSNPQGDDTDLARKDGA